MPGGKIAARAKNYAGTKNDHRARPQSARPAASGAGARFRQGAASGTSNAGAVACVSNMTSEEIAAAVTAVVAGRKPASGPLLCWGGHKMMRCPEERATGCWCDIKSANCIKPERADHLKFVGVSCTQCKPRGYDICTGCAVQFVLEGPPPPPSKFLLK
eukprot:Tamp_34352.p1 GENE.Tamp_34352~~Tamp_34352.p1  ORF type:complete len:159 (-),score=9.58 Tamp_34352:22-498(-)